MKIERSLRKQFLTRMFVVLLLVAVVSGLVQFYIIKQQISEDTQNQAAVTATSIQQGIRETNLATKAIEHQIDIKMARLSKHIASTLGNKRAIDISTEDLLKLRDEFSLAGISLFTRDIKENTILVTKATEPQDIGFSFKTFGYLHLQEDMMAEKEPALEGAYTDINTLVLETAQSASHTEEPEFFKYAYYHPPGSDYILDPYIKANEIYQFTKEVGPEVWIKEVVANNPYIQEVAVLDPTVYKDPTMETKLYPPKKRITNGTFKYQDERDELLLRNMDTDFSKTAYVTTANGVKLYKSFTHIGDGKVLYVAVNYDKISGPLYRYSIVLIVSGFISLIALFVLAARFFTNIYRNIQKIIAQTKALESGDFTAKSNVSDKGELSDLSESSNHMVDTLHGVLSDTTEKATQIKFLSSDLEMDANNSVEKVYILSMEITSTAREDAEELGDFIETLENSLHPFREEETIEKILSRIETIKTIFKNRSVVATDITIALSDLLKSLQGRSVELSDISKSLLTHMEKFKL